MKIKNTTSRPKVLLIYTGGTIGMIRNTETGAWESYNFPHLCKHVPEMNDFGYQIDNYQFDPPIDSSDMDPSLWKQLVDIISTNYDQYDGFVILHGTDTMAYTASALSFMLEDLTKPVILTGSQLPIGILRTDGKENLLTAIEMAAAKREDGSAWVPEVCVFFERKLMRGNRVTKANAEEFNAFQSYNCPPLATVGVDISYNETLIRRPKPGSTLKVHTQTCNDVLALTLFPGIPRTLIEEVMHIPYIKGIILRTFGSGNAPQHQWLTDALIDASISGKIVLNVTQCQGGSVMMHRYETGRQLLEAGVVSGRDITMESAITKLMVLIGSGHTPDQVRALMNRSLCGEITMK